VIGINVGSGQRRFNTAGDWTWYNLDIQYKPPDQVPDLLSDGVRAIQGMTADIVVLHHILEHFGCGEADYLIKECWKVLKPGGSLLVFVPNAWALAQRYILRQIDNYTFNVNTYGAYQGEEEDRHRWSYDYASLQKLLKETLWGDGSGAEVYGPSEQVVKFFDWREIPGASLARDWWVLAMEAVKE